MTDSPHVEPIIEPDLPIVDAHHHLWYMPEHALSALESEDSILARAVAPNYRRHACYLFDEFLSDVATGHNVRATVFVDAHAMYRASGPAAMKSVGEVEFANGVAAMAASGIFGDVRVCAGIVGGVDLRLGDEVEDVIDAHLRAGGARYRGIRSPGVPHDDDTSILGPNVGGPHLLRDARFRTGLKRLQAAGLSFDVWLLEPQLPDLIDLAVAFPETSIVLNHLGAPVGVGRYTGQREERFPLWRRSIQTLSRCENVTVKLGGLGIPFAGFDYNPTQAMSSHLAELWRPYIETCIEVFGVDRCMFESNFPVDAAACSYRVLWNTFKRLAAGASETEKTALFSGTAVRTYRLEI
jgi:predicted TIM-barrel fold metal-dependent hydrolase